MYKNRSNQNAMSLKKKSADVIFNANKRKYEEGAKT